jgi:hypothetical protein
MDVMDYVQWPAMVVTVAAAWLVASKWERRRLVGYWAFLVSNVLWIAWAWPAHAYALVALQVILGMTNLRGLREVVEKRKEDRAAG